MAWVEVTASLIRSLRCSMECAMKIRTVLTALTCLFAAGCDDHFQRLWHGETLASGGMVKVISFNLVWGIEHDDRDATKDSFALEYVMADRSPDPARREAEA